MISCYGCIMDCKFACHTHIHIHTCALGLFFTTALSRMLDHVTVGCMTHRGVAIEKNVWLPTVNKFMNRS